MEDKNNKPKHFLICKILGAFLIVTGITLIILANTVCAEEVVLGDWNTGETSANFALLALGGFMIPISFALLAIGFTPEITKMSVKSKKYIQAENKEDLTNIVDNTADITSGAITKTTQAIKKGLRDTMFCSECGAEIDVSSKYCNHCGKKVE